MRFMATASVECASVEIEPSDMAPFSASDARRLRQLEDENGKLKRLLADSMLDNAILKDLLGKA